MTEVEEQPPRVMSVQRRAVDEMCAGRTDVVVEHNVLDDAGGGHGWNRILSPVARGSRVWFWFDGVEEDLMLMIDDEYHFEWLDRTDEAAVVADVLGICSAVLAGELQTRRQGRWRHLDLWTTDGRRWTGRGGRDSLLPWKRSTPSGRQPGYGSVGDA